MEKKLKHLEMIQTVISRMAANSFQLKGLCVTIAVAVSALAVVRSNAILYLLLLIPILSFWLMDAHYLHQEKLFRALFDTVRNQDESQIDFSMNTAPFKKKCPSVAKCFFLNWSTIGFYLPFVVIVAVLFFVATCSMPCNACMGG